MNLTMLYLLDMYQNRKTKRVLTELWVLQHMRGYAIIGERYADLKIKL